MEKADRYIYIREHESYAKYDVCKLGTTSCIPETDLKFKENEFIPGKFTMVVKIYCDLVKLYELHHAIKLDFEKYKGGRNDAEGFYYNTIKLKLEDILTEYGVEYRVLTPREIEFLWNTYNMINLLIQNPR